VTIEHAADDHAEQAERRCQYHEGYIGIHSLSLRSEPDR
jgi:hypothetical protein